MDASYGLLAYPPGHGYGWEEIVAGAAPAAGANFALPIPGQFKSRLLAIVFTLVTDGTAANRFVTVTYANANGTVYAVNGAGVVVTASTTQRFVGQVDRGSSEWAANTDVFFPVTGLILSPTDTINVNVANKQAGDQLSAITLVLQRLLTGPLGYTRPASPEPAAGGNE